MSNKTIHSVSHWIEHIYLVIGLVAMLPPLGFSLFSDLIAFRLVHCISKLLAHMLSCCDLSLRSAVFSFSLQINLIYLIITEGRVNDIRLLCCSYHSLIFLNLAPRLQHVHFTITMRSLVLQWLW